MIGTMSKENSGEVGQEITTDDPDYLSLRERAAGTNVNDQTLLATDYLNHFNEVVMLLEMIPDMPDMLEEAREWQPRPYKEHFAESSIADCDLAVEAYDSVPTKYKAPFEQTISQLDRLIASSINRLEQDLSEGNVDLARENASALSQILQRLIDIASGIISGSDHTMDQSEIDILLGD